MNGYEILDCVLVAISAWVITGPMMDSDMLLEPYRLRIERFPLWLGKPLGLCGTCFTGQFALWFYVIENNGKPNIFSLVFFICLSIFTYKLITKWNNN